MKFYCLKKSLVFILILFSASITVLGQSFSNKKIKLNEFKNKDGEKSALQKWREDLEYIKRELPAKHKNLFHRLDQDLFYREIEKVDAKLPTLTKNQAALELARIVALAKDGHTQLFPIFDPKMKFNLFPISMYFFEEGIYVRKASPEYRDIVGGKVLKIGNMKTKEAYKRVSPYIPADNKMWYREYAPLMLASPEILQALGIASNAEKVQFEIEKDGKVLKKEMKLLPNKDNSVRAVRRSIGNWVDARENAKNPTPLTLKNTSKRFWFEYVKDKKLLFVQLNGIGNDKNKTLAQFFGEVFDFAKKNELEKFVLDIRHNGGGNNTLIRPIIRGLIQLEKIDRKGHLFVIIGRRTFSAAQNLTNMLETWTNAVFIGEPTGSHVNMYGDARWFELPNSKLRLRISELWWQNMSERDTRIWTAPSVAAEPSFSAYIQNIDPAMQAVYNYEPQRTLESMGLEAYQKGDFALIKKILVDFKNDPRNKYVEIERTVNRFGYQLIRIKNYDHAIKIFQMNVDLYPNSYNVYDSLAEAYMLKGDKEKATKNYRKSLELNPNNTNAVKMLKKLKVGGHE